MICDAETMMARSLPNGSRIAMNTSSEGAQDEVIQIVHPQLVT